MAFSLCISNNCSAIENLPNTLGTVFSQLHEETQWSFTVLMGGLPSNGEGGVAVTRSVNLSHYATHCSLNLQLSRRQEPFLIQFRSGIFGV